MRARIIKSADISKFLDLLRKDYEVIAPFRGRGRDTYFDTVTDENQDQVQIHFPNPYYPPKRFVLPHIERLMRIKGAGSNPTIETEYEERKFAVFGIRSCDVAGIYHLDRFFLGRGYRDIYYEKRRKNLFLINVVCSDPQTDIEENCYCLCTDTGPAAREHFDMQIMDLGEELMVVAGTEAGEKYFEHPLFQKGTPGHVEKRRKILGDVRHHFKNTTSWFSAAVRFVSQGKVPDTLWEEVGYRCLECGGCTYVCPACTCFTVTDRKTDQGEIERVRLWDACALSGYTRMAGGFNPRKAVHDRRNRRFFRKLAHYFIQRELSMACVGCGRCVEVCHGDVGMPSVVEMIRRSTTMQNQNEPAAT